MDPPQHIRRAIQIASYQRSELFDRRPSIIPTALKMLIEPDVSQRTSSLLNISDFDSEEGSQYAETSEPEQGETVEMMLALDRLRLTIESLCDSEKSYKNLIDWKNNEKTRDVTASEESEASKSEALSRLNGYFLSLSKINSLEGPIIQTDHASWDSGVVLREVTDMQRRVSALRHVVWVDKNI
jgi:hypothetical protein